MQSRRNFIKLLGLTGAGLMLPLKNSGKILAKSLPQVLTGAAPVTLTPTSIPKYVTKLVIPPAYLPDTTTYPGVDYYEISAKQIGDLPVLPPMGGVQLGTRCWGYSGVVEGGGTLCHSPAATIEAVRGRPVYVLWKNELNTIANFGVTLPAPTPLAQHLLKTSIDPTIGGAEPVTATPGATPSAADYAADTYFRIVPHLHGGEVPAQFDGIPSWWWSNTAVSGNPDPDAPAGSSQLYKYPNCQEAATLWYHDHTMGTTRINTMAGLAGFYLLREPNEAAMNLPRNITVTSGANSYKLLFEVPIAIQDRTFTADGQIYYPVDGLNPLEHPNWQPEFFGDTIMVNGRVWPYLKVLPRKYRFRVLNGSNARMYNLKLSVGVPIYQIGTEGGFLPSPVRITSLAIMPGERVDLIIDFSTLRPGMNVEMRNDANAPFPVGEPADANTVGKIMQFKVVTQADFKTENNIPQNVMIPADTSVIPSSLNPGYTALLEADAVTTRTVTLNEAMSTNGPVAVLVNSKNYMDPVSETPVVGTTEVWQIVNMTMDAHPIHLHLVEFQLLRREKFDVAAYKTAYANLNGMPMYMPHPTAPMYAHGMVMLTKDMMTMTPTPLNPATNQYDLPPIAPFKQGGAILPAANERGWKDTIKAFPGEITTIIAKFQARWITDNTNTGPYALPASFKTSGALAANYSYALPYVWHCHILDHEDNDMMARMHALVPNATVLPKHGIADAGTMPLTTALLQNYPNPFNPTTEIPFRLANRERVEVRIFNTNGQEVRTLVNNFYEAGEHRVSWNGKNNWGVGVSSGVYIARLTAGSFSKSIKMNLLR